MMYIISVIAIAVLTALDQVTKHLAAAYLENAEPFVIIKGVFELNFARNEGAAFSILQGTRWFLVGFTIIVFVFLIYFYIKLPKTRFEKLCRISLILVASGALGNFICRLLWGNVIDFFYFRLINFPLFNVADIFVVAGCFLLVFALIFEPSKETVEIENESEL